MGATRGPAQRDAALRVRRDRSGARGAPVKERFAFPATVQRPSEDKTKMHKSKTQEAWIPPRARLPRGPSQKTALGGRLEAPAETGTDTQVSFVSKTKCEASGSVSSVSARPGLAEGSAPRLPGPVPQTKQ